MPHGSGCPVFIDLPGTLSCSHISHQAVCTLCSLLPFEDAAELLLKPTTAKSLHQWQDVAVKVYGIDFSVTKPKAENTGELTLENYLILFRVTQNPLPNLLI